MTRHASKNIWKQFSACTALGLILLGPNQYFCWSAQPVVDAAIKRGALYIQRLQRPDGSWQASGHQLGETSLAGLALLAAGYPTDSPIIAGAARAVRQLARDSWKTYDVSLAVMFLDQVGGRQDEQIIRLLGGRLAQGQAANGCWTYTLNGSSATGDNSNAQFAALASWICRRHGAVMDDTVHQADQYFRSTVNQAGGWGYHPDNASTATMTCAGLVALATEQGRSIQQSKAPSGNRRKARQQDGPERDLTPNKQDPVVQAALQYLALQLRRDRIEVEGKQFAGLYFYWSLERVGVIYGLREIQGIDWYDWGVERLLPKQRQDGGWGGQSSVDTAFAILFLTKANVAEDLTKALGGWNHGDPGAQRQPPDTFLRVERKRRPKTRAADQHEQESGPRSTGE